jgi:transcription elongation factor
MPMGNELQKEIIDTVLKSTKSKKRKVIETKWFEFLEKKLEFPFEAEVSLISYSEVFNDGDIVKVLDIYDMVDMYGVLMKIKKNRKTFVSSN